MKPTRFVTAAALGLALVSTPAEARSRHARAWDMGTVEVQNRAGVPLVVQVEGGGIRTLMPFETERFVVPEGRRSVEATYELYGKRFTLFSREVRVHDHRVTRLEATPVESAQVRLINDSGAEAEFVVSGREVAELQPGESRIVRLPFGEAQIQAFARGIQLESESVFLRPFSETTLIAEPPSTAQLVVDNPLPIAVQVAVGPAERRIEPYGRAVFERVPVGSVEVLTRRVSGERLDCERVSVRAWTGGHLTVETPTVGLVRLESEDDDMLRVFVDGHVVATLAPMQVSTVQLPVGNAYVEVRTLDGRLVERESLYVSPFGAAVIDFGSFEYDRGQHHRSDRGRHGGGHHEEVAHR